jgi:hypothetical protein
LILIPFCTSGVNFSTETVCIRRGVCELCLDAFLSIRSKMMPWATGPRSVWTYYPLSWWGYHPCQGTHCSRLDRSTFANFTAASIAAASRKKKPQHTHTRRSNFHSYFPQFVFRFCSDEVRSPGFLGPPGLGIPRHIQPCRPCGCTAGNADPCAENGPPH